MGKRHSISTTSSLSSISEDSTFGVEGEDLPPQVPRRRRSFGRHRSISATGNVSEITDEADALESIHEENAENGDLVRSPRSSGRRSSSNRKRTGHSSSGRTERNAEEESTTERTQRKRLSSSSSSPPSSHKSSKSDRGDGSSSESNRSESSSRSYSRRRSSSSHQRSSSLSSTASESKADPDTSGRFQQEDKIKEMIKRKNSSRSRRSPSSSSSSERDTLSSDDEALKQSEAEDRRRLHPSSSTSSSSSSRRRRRHSRSSSRRSSSNQSTADVSESDASTQFSRNLDRRGAQHEFRRNASPQEGHEGSLSDDGSQDESRPGAYRVSSYSSNRRLHAMSSLGSSSGNTYVPENSLDESNSSFSVTAEVARDMTDEIEAARQQGRVEGLRQASTHRNNSVVASVARPSRRKSKMSQESRNSRKKWLLFLVFSFCIIVAGSVSAFFAFSRKTENQQIDEVVTSPPSADENSGLEAVVSFDPPTAEDCASIANGTAVAGQEDMFTQFVDMHVQITSASDQDKALLVKLLEQQIQLNLLPRLVGCNELTGNVIGNGVIDSVSNETSTCLFQNNPLCLEVVLTVKIYLRREEDGDVVLEIASELLLDEDLNETLELPPNVETVGDPFITPSNHTTNVPTETPSWSPSASITFSQPSATPTVMVVDTPSASPLARSVAPMEPNMPTVLPSIPTIKPTRRPTPTPSPAPTFRPVILDYSLNDETDPPVLDYQEQPSDATPSAAPSSRPTKNPSTSPSASPSFRPTRFLSTRPSTVPSRSPTVVPSETPTTKPSAPPSSDPSSLPSRSPTVVPSETPTTKPSAPPSSDPSSLPTLSPTRLPTAVYWAIDMDQKCPHGADRLFKIDNVADVDECYNACSSTPGCFVFSVGMNAGEQNCMGCRTPDTLEAHDGFTAYQYQLPSTDEYTPVEINKKCPLELTAGVTHPDRLFRINNVADENECYNACSSTTGCAAFSVGTNGGGQLICIGCTTTATLVHHWGFTSFELTP